MNMSEDISENI